MNLLSPTPANGPIVLCWEGAEARAWEWPGSRPEGHRGGHSLFAWPQNGSSVIHVEGAGHSRGYLVVASNGQCRVWVPIRGPLKRGSSWPPAHFWETKALGRLVRDRCCLILRSPCWAVAEGWLLGSLGLNCSRCKRRGEELEGFTSGLCHQDDWAATGCWWAGTRDANVLPGPAQPCLAKR